MNDWGRTAVNGKTVLPGSGRKVYIIDSGVAQHDDLSSVSQRVNVHCGTGADCSTTPVSPLGLGYYSTVGCYAHGTHVAGIVGADANGTKPRVGVYAGVDMVSIAMGITPGEYNLNGAWIPCAYEGFPESVIGYAFDFITAQLQPTGPIHYSVAVATLSANSALLGFTGGVAESNRSKLLKMVNPGPVWRYRDGLLVEWYYPGVFFTQSAGNQNQNACNQRSDGSSSAFQTTPSPTGTAVDGIMVVGAIRNNGTAVSDSSGPIGGPYFTLSEPRISSASSVGSNFGSCVDIWAPGDAIYSTWGSGRNETYATGIYSGGQPENYVLGSPPGSPIAPYSGAPSTGFFGWQWLSGTSMAAPHVAAAGAYMADKYNLSTPAAIEQKIRDNWQNWGAVDPTIPTALPVRIVYLPD